MLHQFSDIQSTNTIELPSHAIEIPGQYPNQFNQNHQSYNSEIYLQSSSQPSITNTFPAQQKEYGSYFKQLIKQQLEQNSDFCKIIGQKMLQILYIKIVNKKKGNKSSIMKTSLTTLQKNICYGFLRTEEEISTCLKQQKILMLIGTLFLNQDYKHLEIIQKQLSAYVQQYKNEFSQRASFKKELLANQCQHFDIVSQSPQISNQRNLTLKRQQKCLFPIIEKDLSPIKQELVFVNKAQIASDQKKLQNLKQQQPFNKFAQFLNEQKYKNDRKKPTNNHSKQNLIRQNNNQRYNKGRLQTRKKQKYISKDEVSQNKRTHVSKNVQQNLYPYYYQCNEIYPYYYQHNNNYQYFNYIKDTNYQQYQLSYPTYHNYYQHQHITPEYYQYQCIPPSNQYLHQQYKSQYQNHNLKFSYQQVQQNLDVIKQPELKNPNVKKFEQKLKQVQISKIIYYKGQEQNDLSQLIKQIASDQKCQQIHQSSINLQSIIEEQDILNEYENLRDKGQDINDNNNISPKHKRNIQQYLTKIKNTRSQINILCQQFGMNFPNFERKMIDNKFFVEGTLQFQSIYLNKQKIKIRAQGLGKNTKQATQIVSRKILRIIYQNIQQMWRDFVKIKEKKGLRL